MLGGWDQYELLEPRQTLPPSSCRAGSGACGDDGDTGRDFLKSDHGRKRPAASPTRPPAGPLAPAGMLLEIDDSLNVEINEAINDGPARAWRSWPSNRNRSPEEVRCISPRKPSDGRRREGVSRE